MLVKACVNEISKQVASKGRNLKIFYYAPTAGDLKGSKVGQTEKFIKAAYQCASDKAKAYEQNMKSQGINAQAVAIIFIDEVDGIAGRRELDKNNVTSVNSLLQAIDGIRSSDNVLTIAATNFPWNLDSAFLERFDRQILIDLPSEDDIDELLNRRLNRLIATTVGRSSPAQPTEKVENELDGCNAPQETGKRFIWTEQRTNGFFRDLTSSDIREIARYSNGTQQFPYTLENGTLVSRAITATEPGKIMKLSNRTVDKIFRQVRLSTLKKAKKCNLVVRVGNPYGGEHDMYFSSDSLDDEQWLSQFESIGKEKAIPDDKFFVFKRGNYRDLVVIDKIGNSERKYLLNSNIFPLLNVNYNKSLYESIYAGVEYAAETPDSDSFDIYFRLFIMYKMYEDYKNSDKTPPFQTVYNTYSDQVGDGGQYKQQFEDFKKLSTQEIHARIKLCRYVSPVEQVVQLFRLRVHRFDRIKDATYHFLFQTRVAIQDYDEKLKDVTLQNKSEKAHQALRELLPEVNENELSKLSKVEILSMLQDDQKAQFNELAPDLSGTRYEKVYLLVSRKVDLSNGWAAGFTTFLTSFKDQIKVMVTGNKVTTKEETAFEQQMQNYRAKRSEQFSLDKIFAKSGSVTPDIKWIVPSDRTDLEDKNTFNNVETNYRVFDGSKFTTIANEVMDVISGANTFHMVHTNKSEKMEELWGGNYILHVSSNDSNNNGYLWNIGGEAVAKNIDLNFTKARSIDTDAQKEQYYTSWNITKNDFLKELCIADSSLDDTELGYLYRYKNKPSDAAAIRKLHIGGDSGDADT